MIVYLQIVRKNFQLYYWTLCKLYLNKFIHMQKTQKYIAFLINPKLISKILRSQFYIIYLKKISYENSCQGIYNRFWKKEVVLAKNFIILLVAKS